eukprot:1888686-Prymnesium_polylepis.2
MVGVVAARTAALEAGVTAGCGFRRRRCNIRSEGRVRATCVTLQAGHNEQKFDSRRNTISVLSEKNSASTTTLSTRPHEGIECCAAGITHLRMPHHCPS